MTQTFASTLPVPVAEDMHAVNAMIRRRLGSKVMLINQIGEYTASAGGKRLRPVILLLVANALGYKDEHQHELAAAVESVHTATLLYDDVVNESDLCRDHKTASAIFDNTADVLAGNFLYSRAFQMTVQANSMRIMQVLADATNTIFEGEVLQLLDMYDPDVTKEHYLQTIRYRTVKLLEVAAQIDTVLSGADAAAEEAAAEYGRRIDTAFQIVDDLLNYISVVDQIGKNVGDDLHEGKPILPLTHLLSNGTEGQRALVRQTIEQGGTEHFDTIFAAIQTPDALEYTHQTVEREATAAEAAVNALLPSLSRQIPIDLYAFSLQRQP